MRSNWKHAGRITAVTILVVAATAAAGPGPEQATEALVAAFKSVTPAPDSGAALTAAQRKANAAAFAKLDALFDFERLVADPIAPIAGKMTPEQRAKFGAEFKELIRLVAYPGAGGFFASAEYSLKPAKAGADGTSDVLMKAYLAEEDIQTNATFHWARTAAGWRVVDVSFDGASLVKDYRAQFGRIVDKEGVQGLLDRVSKRLAAERKASAGLL